MTDIPISAPGGYAPVMALAFGALDGAATIVDGAHPLPIAVTLRAAISSPLVGTANASSVAGPFTPDLGRAIVLTLSGSWTGSVQLLRSTDAGTTKLPVTAGGSVWGLFAANCNEPLWVETDAAATFYLQIEVTSGTVAYRVSQ